MRIGICDDIEQELRTTERWCKKYLDEHELEGNIFCAVKWEDLSGKDLDLLLLDVEMPERDGIAIKEELGKEDRPLIVFVTGYEEYMPQAFGKNVIGFVRKPIQAFDINLSLDCAVRLINAGKKIDFENGVTISSEHIQYFASDSRYTKAVLDDGTEKTSLNKTLAAWEKETEDIFFLRISHSHLVNSRFIYDFTADAVILVSGEKLKVSRRRKSACVKQFMEYVRQYGKHA